jgi:hypothetical protein
MNAAACCYALPLALAIASQIVRDLNAQYNHYPCM